MSTIKSSTTTTTAYQVVADTTGALVIQTGATPTTAVTIGADQSVTFAGAVSLSGNQTTTGNLTVNGNTTLGDASTDTILMTGAPSIGGAGLGMGMGFRNRIINGAMVIDQRNAGASVTPTNGQYTLDRWCANMFVNTGKFTVRQTPSATETGFAVRVAAGFSNYLAVTSTSSYSIGTGDIYTIFQSIEGFNVADFAWGTANAKTITISFLAYSSLTGTFGGAISNGGGTRAYPFTYTISSANTWTSITITIAGDTTGTWTTDNSSGMQLRLGLGVGSTYSTTAGAWAAGNYFSATGATSVVGTNGATFYITGVQLEKGSTATSFDYRPYGTELQLCQRYFNTVKAMNGTSGGTTTTMYSNVSYPEMRAVPTYAVTGAIIATDPANASYTQSSGNVSVAGGSYSNGAFLAFGNFSGMTANRVIMLNTATTYLTLSAEL